MLKQLGIESIRVELPFRLNHVNCFLVEGENGATIIDTGLHNDQTKQLWNDKLQNKEVEKIIITHYHPDHVGYAGALQQKMNAEVWMSEIDSDALIHAWSPTFIDNLQQYYEASGIPTSIGEQMQENTKEFIPLLDPLPTVNHYLMDGATIQIGNFEYELIRTPGHSEGMFCFYQKEHNVLLAADHILPRITPNISYWYHGDDNPLHSYLTSLVSLQELAVDYVIPSHGEPFRDANTRIDEIIAHHDERLAATLQAVGNGSSVYEVFQKLFQWQLTIHEIRFAVGETLAHLEYLRKQNLLVRELQHHYWVYYRK